MRREKAIYHTLNKLSMDTSRKVLLAEAWCPLAAKPYVHEALRRAAQDSSTQVSTVLQPLVTDDPPPTYFKTDKFTSCFQVGRAGVVCCGVQVGAGAWKLALIACCLVSADAVWVVRMQQGLYITTLFHNMYES